MLLLPAHLLHLLLPLYCCNGLGPKPTTCSARVWSFFLVNSKMAEKTRSNGCMHGLWFSWELFCYASMSFVLQFTFQFLCSVVKNEKRFWVKHLAANNLHRFIQLTWLLLRFFFVWLTNPVSFCINLILSMAEQINYKNCLAFSLYRLIWNISICLYNFCW